MFFQTHLQPVISSFSQVTTGAKSGHTETELQPVVRMADDASAPSAPPSSRCSTESTPTSELGTSTGRSSVSLRARCHAPRSRTTSTSEAAANGLYSKLLVEAATGSSGLVGEITRGANLRTYALTAHKLLRRGCSATAASAAQRWAAISSRCVPRFSIRAWRAPFTVSRA